MTGRAATCATIGTLSLLLMAAFVEPSAADGYEHHYSRYRHHAHVAYVGYPAYYGTCLIGWWQTVRYGHVRPRWAEYCR